MIGFFEDRRVETLKEAINLLFDEKRKDDEEIEQMIYREEMLELQRQQAEASEEAAYYAKCAAHQAEIAANNSTFYSNNN